MDASRCLIKVTLSWHDRSMGQKVDVEDFVAESLGQVIAGIKKAQAKEDGMNVNASMVGVADVGGNLLNGHNYGMFTRVDFDIAFTAETTGKGGAGLKIWVVGADAGVEHKAGTASRVSFSVPLRLPDGDKKRQQQFDAEQEAEYRAISRRNDESWV